MSRLNLRGGFGIPGAVAAPLTSAGFGVPILAIALSTVQKQIINDVELAQINYQIDQEVLPEYRGLSISDKSELKREAYDIYFRRLDDTLSENLNLGRSKDVLRAIITAKQAGLKNDDVEALYRKHNLLETYDEAIGGYGVPRALAAKTFILKQINSNTELSIINKQIEEGQLPELQNLSFSEKTALKTFAYDLYLQKVDKMVDDARNNGRNEIEQRAIIDTRKSNLKDADYQALYKKYNLTPSAIAVTILGAENLAALEYKKAIDGYIKDKYSLDSINNLIDMQKFTPEITKQLKDYLQGEFVKMAADIKAGEETAAQIKIAQNPDDFNPTKPGKIGNIGVLEAVYPIAQRYGFTNVMQEYKAKKEMIEAEKKQKIQDIIGAVGTFALALVL
jgi:hypothetical protein